MTNKTIIFLEVALMDDVKNILERQRAFFSSGKTKELPFCIAMLKAPRGVIKKCEKEILDTLKLMKLK